MYNITFVYMEPDLDQEDDHVLSGLVKYSGSIIVIIIIT